MGYSEIHFLTCRKITQVRKLQKTLSYQAFYVSTYKVTRVQAMSSPDFVKVYYFQIILNRFPL